MKEITIFLTVRQLEKLKRYCLLTPDIKNEYLLLSKFEINKHMHNQFFEYNPITGKMILDSTYRTGRNRHFFGFIATLFSKDKQLQLELLEA